MVLIDQETKKEIPQEDTASYINRFFTSIVPNLSSETKEPWIYEGVTADRYLFDIEVNTLELQKICKEIDVHNSSSVDKISSRILKDAFFVADRAV